MNIGNIYKSCKASASMLTLLGNCSMRCPTSCVHAVVAYIRVGKASASMLTLLAYIRVGNEVIDRFRRIGAVHGVNQRFPKALLTSCLLFVLVFSHTAGVAQTAYSINSLDSTLSVYGVSKSGRLKHQQFIPVPKNPKAIAIHPDTRRVYVVSKATAQISVYAKEAFGLREMEYSPYNLGLPSPFAIKIHASGKFLYIASRAGAVLAYSIADDGRLSPIKGSPYKSGPRTRSLVIHPSGNYLYAVNAHANSVTAFVVSTVTGELSYVPGSPFRVSKKLPTRTMRPIVDVPPDAGGIPYFIAAHPSGRYLYVTNWASATVSVLRVNLSTGALTGSPFATGRNPFAVSVHPGGEYVYVSCWSDHQIHTYKVNKKNGALKLVHQVASGGFSPTAVQFSQSGEVAYVSNAETDTLSVFRFYKKTGKLRLRQQLQTRAGSWAVELARSTETTTTVPLLFALDLHRRFLLAFSVGEKGAVTLQANATLPYRPVDLVTIASGRVAIVAYRNSGRLDSYVLSTRGKKWTRLKSQDMDLGKGQKQLLVDANERYLYVLNKDNNKLTVVELEVSPRLVLFKRHSTKSSQAKQLLMDSAARFLFENNTVSKDITVRGFLSASQPSVFERRKWGSPYSVQLSPDLIQIGNEGRFLYIAHQKTKNISTYSVQHRSGALKPVAADPLLLEQGVNIMVQHPDRSFMYAVEGERKITTLSRSTVTGVLRKKDSISTQGKILSMAIESSGRYVYVSYKGKIALDIFKIGKRGELKFLANRKTRGRQLKLYAPD